MDLSQNENRKLILPVLLFILVLSLVILGSVLYLQGKNTKIQNQINPIQPPQSKSLPVLPSVSEPSNLPESAAPSKKEEIPLPANATEPPKSPDIIPPANKENIPAPLNVSEPSKSFDKIPSSDKEKIPLPLP